jgi:prevent-host-death family protein
METVGAYEAKTHLPKLLERVMKGERITITKHGVPVAVLQPPDPEKIVDTKSVIAELRKLRNRHALNGLSIREMIEDGRR